MTSQEFVELLEKHEVISPIDLDSLREQIALANPPMHPAFIARRLVQMGYLNSYFAKNLLAGGAGGEVSRQLPDEDFQLEPLEEDLSEEFAALEDDSDFQDLELNLPPLEDTDMLRVPAVPPQPRPNVAPLANPHAARKKAKERAIPLPLMIAMVAAGLLVVFIVVMITAQALLG